jgi:hypothetical protein
VLDQGAVEVARNIFEDPQLLLTYYQTQAEEFRMRHKAIWEEIRHYTWLLSILLGWPIILFSNRDFPTVSTLIPSFVVLPVLGLFFSVTAFFVIRREYHFYNEVDARLLYIERELGLTSRSGFLDNRLRKGSAENYTVEKHIESVRPIGSFVPWKARIRALFLGGFIVFALVAVGEIVYCLSFAF